MDIRIETDKIEGAHCHGGRNLNHPGTHHLLHHPLPQEPGLARRDLQDAGSKLRSLPVGPHDALHLPANPNHPVPASFFQLSQSLGAADYIHMNKFKYKPTINQHEFMEMVMAGIPAKVTDRYNVVDSNRIDMDWKGDDGKTLGYNLRNNLRWPAAKIIFQKGGMDFPTTMAYFRSHWDLWLDNKDMLVINREAANG